MNSVNDIKLESLDYILARHKAVFKKQEVETVYDLLTDFPVRYENYTVSSIDKAVLDETIVLEGQVASKVSVTYLKTKLTALSFIF